MVKYTLNPVTSSPVNLYTVPLAADVKIVSVNWPSSPKIAGDVFGFTFRIRNDGYDADITIWVHDNITGEQLWSIGWSLAHGEEEDVYASFAMPYQDIRLKLSVGYDGTVTDTVTDTKNIESRIVDVGTSLTLSLSPTTVPSGGLVNFNGKLTIEDVAINPGVQEIRVKCDDPKWLLNVAVQTDNAGNFNGSFNAPQDGGGFGYAVYSRFEGGEIEGLQLGAASSTLSQLYTSIPLRELKWWQWGLLLGWAALGGVGVALGRKR